MKSFIVFFALVAVALAGPFEEAHVDFSEDTAGNYNLKYKSVDASRNEQRFQDGRLLGSYSFVDPEGKHHTVTYVAAANQGFVASGASLPVDNNPAPVPVQETHEIHHARAEHLAIHQRELAQRPHNFVEERPVSAQEVLAKLTVPHIPTDHSDDSEAQHAKAALRSAYQEALEKLANEYKRF